MNIKTIIISISLMILSGHSQAQFSKLLKEKAKKLQDKMEEVTKDAAREHATDKLNEKNSGYDSVSFLLALAVVDNSGIYEKFELGRSINKVASYFINGEKQNKPEDKANQLIEKGEPLYASRKFKAAEKAFLSAKEILEEEQLTTSLDYVKVIADLGLLYNTMGRYSKSEEFTLQALEMRKEMFGTSSKGYIASLNNHAVLSKDLGQYALAEKEVNEAINISAQIDDVSSITYGVLLNNKAMIYQTVGRYDDAIIFLNQASVIFEKVKLDVSGNSQKIMTNLGFVYQNMGKYALAESAYQKATEKLNKKSPVYAQAITNIASLYMEMGRTAEVESKLLMAKGIYEDKLGQEHPLFADAIFNLGKYYRFVDDYPNATIWLEKTLQIRENVLDINHPAYIDALEEVAVLNWNKGLNQKAKTQFIAALDVSLEFINKNFPSMSENEKTKYWDKLRPRFEKFFAFAYDMSDEMPEILANMYDYQLATKAILLSASNKIKKQILNSGNTQLIQNYQLWIDQKELLAGYYAYSKDDLAEENVNLDSIERATNSTEKYLSEQSNSFTDGFIVENKSYKDIKSLLGTDEAALEIIRITTGNTVKYAVLMIDSNTDLPSIAKIENGNLIERRYYKYFRNAVKNKIKDKYSYEQYWNAISKLVSDKKQLYISLGGIYNQISLNTLIDDKGAYLIENWNLTLLGNTKEIIDLKRRSSNKMLSKSAFIMGNPSYGNEAIVPALPGTKKEIEQLSSLLENDGYKIDLYSNDQANETALKKVLNPGILHIATHGYFQQDVSDKKKKIFGISPDNAKNNPLLRSGLMFAGAANTLSGDSTSILDAGDNGILTAYEAMSLSLDKTDLVVLSACETGLGDVKSGEGVYGLQRAFLVAGADALIMSLWKVNDEATQLLMTGFYKNLLTSNDKQKAFKAAQLSLKSKFPEPYYWGAFVLIGG